MTICFISFSHLSCYNARSVHVPTHSCRSRRNCNPGRLFSQLCRSSSLELLFSCHFGLAAASVDTLRRSESSESTAAFGESRLFHQGTPSPGHPGRAALRAADQADASQDEIRYHVQLYSLCGRSPAVSIESERP